jgi:hypothetical protein
MGLLKPLFGERAEREDDDDPADNPYFDDDFSFRDREAARLGDSKHREEEADTSAVFRSV